jgi:hypothetical protein
MGHTGHVPTGSSRKLQPTGNKSGAPLLVPEASVTLQFMCDEYCNYYSVMIVLFFHVKEPPVFLHVSLPILPTKFDSNVCVLGPRERKTLYSRHEHWS